MRRDMMSPPSLHSTSFSILKNRTNSFHFLLLLHSCLIILQPCRWDFERRPFSITHNTCNTALKAKAEEGREVINLTFLWFSCHLFFLLLFWWVKCELSLHSFLPSPSRSPWTWSAGLDQLCWCCYERCCRGYWGFRRLPPSHHRFLQRCH